MSHFGNTQILEYWFEVGLQRGMSEDQAIKFADECFENEGHEPSFEWEWEVENAR
jgi:hypothetical protein|tara:strand:+ start:181 stop:345 length:165 start_codon:yes stop_codon:yes gene_type:complete